MENTGNHIKTLMNTMHGHALNLQEQMVFGQNKLSELEIKVDQLIIRHGGAHGLDQQLIIRRGGAHGLDQQLIIRHGGAHGPAHVPPQREMNRGRGRVINAIFGAMINLWQELVHTQRQIVQMMTHRQIVQMITQLNNFPFSCRYINNAFRKTWVNYQLTSKGVVLTENPEEVVVPFQQPTDLKTDNQEMDLMEYLEAHLNNLHVQLKNLEAQVQFFNASASAIEAKLDTLEQPPPPSPSETKSLD